MQRLLLVLALLAVAPLAHAQSTTAQSAALSTALEHLSAQRTALGLSEADLASVAVTDEYTSRASGVTHLYLRQTVNGVEVINALASAHVTPGGEVRAVHSTFVPSAARAANAAVPSLAPEGAVEAAAQHLGLALAGALTVLEPMDARHRLTLSGADLSLEPIPVQLVYFVTEDGALRLAWDLAVYQTDAQHWWNLVVDAETGAVLEQHDWIVHDEWLPEHAQPEDLRPVAASPLAATRGGGASYNVWAVPLESPIHGDRTFEVDPADPAASPEGWHDTGAVQYTITRGNNVHAYEDRDANNFPGYAPDGGQDLTFDFGVDFATETPVDYQDVAITNLFYWNNAFHDVMYRYGFDEAAGNFQQTNFTGDGAGNDYVQAEAQDGSGTNNANFGTPPDGSRPRMQMFQWDAPPIFEVTSPAEIAQVYETAPASFGPSFPFDMDPTLIVPVESFDGGDYDNGAEDLDLADRGCDEIVNVDEIDGNIALIERGACSFVTKVRNAQDAGAAGVIIHNNSRNGTDETGSPEDLVTMGLPEGDTGSDITIPSAFVRQSTGATLFENTPVEGVLTGQINRDSDLDNGVIVHEYGHGVSNRLTGGPSNASCLSNGEQMGEGWSDYYGLMMTMRPGDTAVEGRGIGTYVSFEETDGQGIRPWPYSTNMEVNPSTYLSARTVSIPHGLGTVWATMLWEMTWDLIQQEGFDADFYEGTGGNNIAFQLVTEGMKLQPCSPGFVDGRDGILEADTMLYAGAYSDIIWRAFAKRGLGFSANQGSSNTINDGSEAFDLPSGVPPVSNEGSAQPGVYTMSAAYPNPFTGRTQFAVEVAEAQSVTVAVFDVMGREVARLHDGLLSAGAERTFELDGSRLASGVYLVRVTGERFATTRRVTLLQ